MTKVDEATDTYNAYLSQLGDNWSPALITNAASEVRAAEAVVTKIENKISEMKELVALFIG